MENNIKAKEKIHEKNIYLKYTSYVIEKNERKKNINTYDNNKIILSVLIPIPNNPIENENKHIIYFLIL